MKEVWLLWTIIDGDWDLDSIYATKEKAETAMDEIFPRLKYRDEVIVEKWPVIN